MYPFSCPRPRQPFHATSQTLSLPWLLHHLCLHRIQPPSPPPVQGPDRGPGLPPIPVQDHPGRRPSSNPNATQSVMELLYYTQKHSVQPLRYLITRLNSANDGFPPVSCVMSDGIMCFAIKVARELGIPEVQFWTASTCGFMAYLQFPHFVDKGIFPIKGT